MVDYEMIVMILLVLVAYHHCFKHHNRRHYYQKHEKQLLNCQQSSNYNDPEIEAIRQQLYSNLKTKLFAAVRREGCPSKRGWLKAFEKWQFISKLTELHHNNITITNSNMNAITLYDPLIPCTLPNNYNIAYNKLKEYLGNLELMPKDGADLIALELTVESYDLVIQIIEFSKSKQLNAKSYDSDVKISYDNSTDLFYLSLKKNSKKLHDFLDYKNNLQSMGTFKSFTNTYKHTNNQPIYKELHQLKLVT